MKKQDTHIKRLKTLAGLATLNENHTEVLLSRPFLGNVYDSKDEYFRDEHAPEIDISHVDDEAGMLADDIYTLIQSAQRLLAYMHEAEESGMEVDFPHWFQSKIVMAKEYITKMEQHLTAQRGRSSSNFFSHQ
jgi:hypothetical protein